MDAILLIAIAVSCLSGGLLIGYNMRKNPVVCSKPNEASDRLCDVIERQSGQIVESHRRVCDQLSIHQDQQLDRMNASHLASTAIARKAADFNYLVEPPESEYDESDLPMEIP
jgi:hypothetical protein